MDFMMFVLVSVPASHGARPMAACCANFFSASSSCLLYFNRRTVRFLGEWQMSSNWVSTSLICLMSSVVVGVYRNLTVLMNADLYWLPRMYAASISKMLSPSAIRFVIASSSMSTLVSRKACTFHFW